MSARPGAASHNGHRPPSVARGNEPWRRSSAFEDGFLEHVTGRAGLRGPLGTHLAALVRARLDKGALEYGPEGYLERPLAELAAELAEEPLDVAGWSILIALRTYRDLDAGTAADVRAELIEIAVDGARLWARAEGLRQFVGR